MPEIGMKACEMNEMPVQPRPNGHVRAIADFPMPNNAAESERRSPYFWARRINVRECVKM